MKKSKLRYIIRKIIQELNSKANGIELKEQLLRQTIFDLQNSVDSLKVKNDTIK